MNGLSGRPARSGCLAVGFQSLLNLNIIMGHLFFDPKPFFSDPTPFF